MGRSRWTALNLVLVLAGCSGAIDAGRTGDALEGGAAGAPRGEGSAGTGGNAPIPGDDAGAEASDDDGSSATEDASPEPEDTATDEVTDGQPPPYDGGSVGPI